jgi:hypothetical protein
MSAPESVLNKVKLLLNLANSPNPNEAENAKAMADKLISKYNITPEELEAIKDKPNPYGEDNKLFVTIGLSSWRQQLALAIAKHFYCKVVQERCTPAQGIEEYNYYIFGEPEDIETVKFVYPAFEKKVEALVKVKCFGRGGIYISSYQEGVTEAIVDNIHWNGIDLPDIKQPSRKIEQEEAPKESSKMEVHKEEAKAPTQESVTVNSQRDMIKDIGAYFKGLSDGKDVSFRDILELEAENEEAKQLPEKE